MQHIYRNSVSAISTLAELPILDDLVCIGLVEESNRGLFNGNGDVAADGIGDECKSCDVSASGRQYTNFLLLSTLYIQLVIEQFCSKEDIKFICIILFNSSFDGWNHILEMSETDEICMSGTEP
jgi:hypothetical protein